MPPAASTARGLFVASVRAASRPLTTHHWVAPYAARRYTFASLDAPAIITALVAAYMAVMSLIWQTVGALWFSVGPLVGAGAAWWLARRAARNDEQRRWAIDFRRLLGKVSRATMRYNALVLVGPDVAKKRAMAITAEEFRRSGWEQWSELVLPLEDDYFLYLEILPFFTNEMRVRAITAWHQVLTDPDQIESGGIDVTQRLGNLRAIVGEMTIRIDRAVGLRTERSKSR
jgi:hypothetical protein